MGGLLFLRRQINTKYLFQRSAQARYYGLIGKPSPSKTPSWMLPQTPVRTRFAPSPTGCLHLGSLRTALYNYLLARATGGQFIVRIEDTDQSRLVQDAETRLYQDLQWAGLFWDEGPDKGGPFGPYKQSERLVMYQEHAQKLLEEDKAFRCFCPREDLDYDLKQATSSGLSAQYPGTCMAAMSKAESDRRAANGEPHTIRFKTSDTPVAVLDVVYDVYKKPEREDNFIIIKSDGFPTYHFANVVDDHLMKISHVIRGSEWLISTPKHVELYNAFGWQPPSFAHVGLLVDHQRQKLSKRDVDNVGMAAFRDMNILPEALLNFAVLLGWDPDLQNRPHLDKKGKMTLDEMKQNFTMKFSRGDIVVDLAKLKFFQNSFIKGLIKGDTDDPDALRTRIIQPIVSKLQEWAKRHRFSPSPLPEEFKILETAAVPSRANLNTFTEEFVRETLVNWKGPVNDPLQFIRDNVFLFWSPSNKDYRKSFKAMQKDMRNVKVKKNTIHTINPDIHKVILQLKTSLLGLSGEQWTSQTLGDLVKKFADSIEYYDVREKTIMNQSAGWKFVRWAFLNGMPGLPIVPMMVLLGQQATIKRLKTARVAARQEEKTLQTLALRFQENLAKARERIEKMGNPFKEDLEILQEQGPKPRNVRVQVDDRSEPNPVSTRSEPQPRPEEDSEAFNDQRLPAQFLSRQEHGQGFRRLLGPPASAVHDPCLQQLLRTRLEAKEAARVAASANTPDSMSEPGPPETAQPERGPFWAGEVRLDRESHIQHLRLINAKKQIRDGINAGRGACDDDWGIAQPDDQQPGSDNSPDSFSAGSSASFFSDATSRNKRGRREGGPRSARGSQQPGPDNSPDSFSAGSRASFFSDATSRNKWGRREGGPWSARGGQQAGSVNSPDSVSAGSRRSSRASSFPDRTSSNKWGRRDGSRRSPWGRR